MFSTRVSAQKTIDALVTNGFQATDIHILARKNDGEHNFVHSLPMNTRFGAVIGALVGMVLLALIGFFIGMNSTRGVQVGEYVLQNQSGLPTLLISTLTGAFIGLVLGAASGALAGNGVPKVISNRYGFYLKEGGLLLAVHIDTHDENKKATDILKASGAQDVCGMYDGEIWELAQQI